MVTMLIAKEEQGEFLKPYDFEIDPKDGPLRELCKYCKCSLAEKDEWLKNSLLDAMRISLSLYGIVRIVHCGNCEEIPCARELEKWLKEKGPKKIKTHFTCVALAERNNRQDPILCRPKTAGT